MDNGLLIGLIALIFFSILLLISIFNNNKEKEKKDFINILETCNNEEQTNALLTELLITAKSSNAKLNIIMWIMLIPIIANIIMLILAASAINEIIVKITSLL